VGAGHIGNASSYFCAANFTGSPVLCATNAGTLTLAPTPAPLRWHQRWHPYVGTSAGTLTLAPALAPSTLMALNQPKNSFPVISFKHWLFIGEATLIV